jgi:hypothetical protein
VRARSEGFTAEAVDRALTSERSLVISWLNRGTLHLVRSEDYGWLHALTTPPLFAGNARRLAQEGITPDAAERGVDVIERSLADEGPLTRRQLNERLDGAGIRTAGQALVHLLARAVLAGIAVRGPMAGREQAYVLVRDWLGVQRPVDRDRALAELARRYLIGHGPAGERDLARWAGLPLRDARAGLAAIAGELVERGEGLIDLRERPRAPPELPAPRLLGAFEPVLLGWISRAPIVGKYDGEIISGGLFRPVALISGRVAAVWRLREGAIELEPLRSLRREERAALEADGDQVLRYLGLSAPRTTR